MAGGLGWFQTHATLHQMRNGFFLRGLENERNPFFSLTAVETDEWWPAMQWWLDLGVVSSRGCSSAHPAKVMSCAAPRGSGGPP
jgi:hypothetical protein